MATTISSREFNQNISRAKNDAASEPVFITDRGKPAYVLLSMADYRRLSGIRGRRVADVLGSPEAADVEFDPPRLGGSPHPAEFD
jgi:prevent-host-death family protein